MAASPLFIGFWPIGIIVCYFLFPLYGRLAYMNPNPLLMPLMIGYGLVELMIAWGLSRKEDWARNGLTGLAIFLVAYGIFDVAMADRPLATYHGIDPIVVIQAIVGAIVLLYIFRKLRTQSAGPA